MTFARIALAGLLVLTMSACSSSSGRKAQSSFNRTSLGQKLHSPKAAAAMDKAENAFFTAGEAAMSVVDKVKLAKLPKIQPVIVQYGTNIADDPADLARREPRWNPNIKQNYSIELPNGDTMLISQKGPQFYRGQIATLIRHGLKVTLIP